MSFQFNQLPQDASVVIRQHSRSFSLAAAMLPSHIRADVEKLYAWCRWCDDAVDEAPSLEEAKTRLEKLRLDVDRIYRGESVSQRASIWLESVVGKYAIPQALPLDLLAGMKTDLEHPVFKSTNELMEYCYQAAGTVGMMMAYMMGATNPQALQRAKSLGMAMQLTNIARDVSEDWNSGRRYLPETWLALNPCKDLHPTNKDVRIAVRKTLQKADELYRCGFVGLRYLPDKSRIAIRAAGNIYQAIGEVIKRENFCVIGKRQFVPLPRKLMIIGKCLIEETSFRIRRALMQKNLNLTTTAWTERKINMNHETKYIGYLGLSLTFVMATTLFFLMGLNPKLPAYSSLPWIYSGCSALIAAFFGLLANRNKQAIQLQPARNQISSRSHTAD